jgi:oxygen-dependent protoporphyrinogen oxidase
VRAAGRSVAVVGGGISGLAAARRLAAAGLQVVLFEAGQRLGGKILTEPLWGRPVEAGPDAFVTRSPEAWELCASLGLEAELVRPPTSGAYLWSRGALHPLPAGLVLGFPSRARPVLACPALSWPGRLRTALEPALPGGRGFGPDPSVAEVARARFGQEALDRLVDPVLAGIHAGDPERLSLAATAPEVAAAARAPGSLMANLGRLAPSGRQPPGGAQVPFATLRGGLSRLVDALASELGRLGAQVRTGRPVGALRRRDEGGFLAGAPGEEASFDAALVATPAPEAALLLADACPQAAATLGTLTHASVALVTFSYPADAWPRPRPGTGFLVPRSEGRLVSACTWMSLKWPHSAEPGRLVLRASCGRLGDDRPAQLNDGELAARLAAELGEAMGLRSGPEGFAVARWPSSLPQYEVGHASRVEAVRSAVASTPGLELAGAYLSGVGIPACIREAHAAADRLAGALAGTPAPA